MQCLPFITYCAISSGLKLSGWECLSATAAAPNRGAVSMVDAIPDPDGACMALIPGITDGVAVFRR